MRFASDTVHFTRLLSSLQPPLVRAIGYCMHCLPVCPSIETESALCVCRLVRPLCLRFHYEIYNSILWGHVTILCSTAKELTTEATVPCTPILAMGYSARVEGVLALRVCCSGSFMDDTKQYVYQTRGQWSLEEWSARLRWVAEVVSSDWVL